MVNSAARLTKSNQVRLADLEFHLWELFRSLMEVAQGDKFYYKNIATILRTIVVSKPNNSRHQPLLINLAKDYEVKLPLNPYLIPILRYEFEEEVSKDTLTKLERYIQKDSIGVWFEEDGSLTRRTLRDLILSIAETDGLAHEDKSVEAWLVEYKKNEEYSNMIDMFLYPAGVRVLKAGLEFLDLLSHINKFDFSRDWSALDFSTLKPYLPIHPIDGPQTSKT